MKEEFLPSSFVLQLDNYQGESYCTILTGDHAMSKKTCCTLSLSWVEPHKGTKSFIDPIRHKLRWQTKCQV